jgi:hypothetical protein
MQSWEESSGHRSNSLLPNVSVAGVATARNESGRAYWTLVKASDSGFSSFRMSLHDGRAVSSQPMIVKDDSNLKGHGDEPESDDKRRRCPSGHLDLLDLGAGRPTRKEEVVLLAG